MTEGGVQTLSNEAVTARLKVMYGALRTSRLNEMYYSERVTDLQRWVLSLQITAALFATSSPIAGWTLWNMQGAKNAWAILAGVAAVISVISPFLKLDDKLKVNTELATGYCLLTFDLKSVRDEVQLSSGLTQKAMDMYEATLARTRELSTKEITNPSVKVRQRLQALVNKEIPPESLWVP